MDKQYQPERTWANEPIQLERIVVAAFHHDPVPQRRLFTPWPAWDPMALIRKMASEPPPDPNRIGGVRITPAPPVGRYA